MFHLSLDRHLRRFFFNYGFVAYRLRFGLIALPVLLAVAAIPALFLYLEKRSVSKADYVFTPTNGRWTKERDAFRRYWKHDDNRYMPSVYWNYTNYLDVILFANESSGNLLNYLPKLQQINDIIEKEIRIEWYNPIFNETANTTYQSFCANFEGWCFDNSETLQFLQDQEAFGRTLEAEMRRRGDLSALLADPGDIARFYEGIFDVRWPSARKQSYENPVLYLVGGVNAVTQLDFTDVYRPELCPPCLDSLRRRLSTSRQFNLSLAQEQRLAEAQDVISSVQGNKANSVAAIMRELETELAYGIGRFDVVRTVRFYYSLKQDNPEEMAAGQAWVQKVRKELYRRDFGEVDVDFYFDARIGESNTKYGQFALNFHARLYISMVVFTLIAGVAFFRRFSDKRIAVDWVRSKMILCLLGVLNAALALLFSVGLLLYVGVPFHTVVFVLPFLVVSIGVDDMFVIVGSWARTNPDDPTPVRLAHALSYSAVAVTITSLTDAISFAVGTWGDVPVIWIFCSYAAVTIISNYIFQLTFFVGFLAIAGDFESSGLHNIIFLRLREDAKTDSCVKRYLLSGSLRRGEAETAESRAASISAAKEKGNAQLHMYHGEVGESKAPGFISRFFRHTYGPAILHPAYRALTALVYIAYLAASIYGISTMTEGSDIRNIPQPIEGDPDGSKYYEICYETFWRDAMPLDFIVTKVPDLYLLEERQRMNATLQEFLYTHFTRGNESVWFWLWRYERYWNRQVAEAIADEREMGGRGLFYRRLRDGWLNIDPDWRWWATSLSFASDEWTPACDAKDVDFRDLCPYYRISAFRFRIAGRNAENVPEMSVHIEKLRQKMDMHPEYGMDMYSQFQPFYESSLVIRPLTLKNVLIVIGILFLVALCFIPSYVGVALVTISNVSIEVGVVGFLSLWDIGLDAVSAITILMSAGFAVNLTAHITHAFIAAKGDAEARVTEALANFGAPILLGGLSSLVGIGWLALHHSHISQIFFRTMLLVVTFGFFHSLLVLPIALATLIPICSRQIPLHDPSPTTGENGHVSPKANVAESNDKGSASNSAKCADQIELTSSARSSPANTDTKLVSSDTTMTELSGVDP